MKSWQALTLATCVVWGIWPILLKAAENAGATRWGTIYVLFLTETIVITAIGFARGGAPFEWQWARWSVLAGVIGVAGLYMFTKALSLGKTGPVTGLSVVYPVVTVAVAWLLWKQKLGLREGMGISLCILGAALIMWEPRT